jgi:tight adherence protein B
MNAFLETNDSLILTAITSAVAGLALGLFLLVRSAAERRRQRVEQRLQPSPDSTAEVLLADQLLPQETAPPSWSDRMDQAFMLAIDRTGLGLSAEQALGIIGLAGACAAVGLYLWREELWLAVVGLLFGLAIPTTSFLWMQGRWKRQLQAQLPDALFFVSRSLRAGLSLEQALDLSGDEGPRPLADELRRCAEQLKLGLAAPIALQSTAKRVNLPDFHIFAAIITLHRSIGGNLTLLLDRLAASVRDRNQFAGYFRSATAMGRITAIAIGAAVPLIFLGYSLFDPDYATRFFESAAGIAALTVAFILEIIGTVWLFFLLRSDY